jgi:hypothetical protein
MGQYDVIMGNLSDFLSRKNCKKFSATLTEFAWGFIRQGKFDSCTNRQSVRELIDDIIVEYKNMEVDYATRHPVQYTTNVVWSNEAIADCICDILELEESPTPHTALSLNNMPAYVERAFVTLISNGGIILYTDVKTIYYDSDEYKSADNEEDCSNPLDTIPEGYELLSDDIESLVYGRTTDIIEEAEYIACENSYNNQWQILTAYINGDTNSHCEWIILNH